MPLWVPRGPCGLYRATRVPVAPLCPHDIHRWSPQVPKALMCPRGLHGSSHPSSAPKSMVPTCPHSPHVSPQALNVPTGPKCPHGSPHANPNHSPMPQLHMEAKHTQSSVFWFLFSRKKKKITFKSQLKWVFDVVLMYRINKLCSDVGDSLLQYYAW